MAREQDKKASGGRPLRPLATVVDGLTDIGLRRRGFIEARLIQRWADVVGPDLAAVCQPEDLRFPRATGGRRRGTLHLRVGGGRAVEIQHAIPTIIARVNQVFGYQAVARVTLTQGPLPTPPEPRTRFTAPTRNQKAAAATKAAAIGDSRLRHALAELGAAIAAKDTGDS